jgi:hypothetical protein
VLLDAIALLLNRTRAHVNPAAIFGVDVRVAEGFDTRDLKEAKALLEELET